MMRNFSVLGVCLLVMAAFWIGTVVIQGFASRVIVVQFRCWVYSHHSNSHLYILNKQLVLRSHSWLFVYYLYPPKLNMSPEKGPKARARKGLRTSNKDFFRGYVWICMDMYGLWICYFFGGSIEYLYIYIQYIHIYIYSIYIYIYIILRPRRTGFVFLIFSDDCHSTTTGKIFPSDRPGWCSRATQGWKIFSPWILF